MKNFEKLSITFALILITATVFAAPPILDSIGTERKFNSFIFATEGQPVTFTAHAADPDGDEVHYFATNYPGWAHFDTNSGVFYGNAPFWPEDYSNRVAQPGVFDITLVADDGTYFVTNYISIYVMATNWLNESLDMRAIVTQRHLAAESVIGTPIDVSIVSDITRATSFGGAGKQIRIVQFAFTSQVPDTVEMESDWISLTNYAFLPVGAPAVPNAGGLIENNYGGLFGINELGERACAELDVPIVVIDAGWDLGHGSDNMTACNTKSNETGDPRYLMYAYSVGHYMRGADALATVIDQLTTQPIEHSTFKIIPMGHSKFGQTCTASAAAFPERVVGFLPTGAASFDSAVARLLNKLQGADPSAPEMSPTYLGCLMRNYIEMLDLANKQASTNAVVIAAFGTDENKNDLDDYKPKYTLFAADKEVELNKRMGCVPNAPHIMTKIGEKYVAAIPANSVALFVELGDFADGLTGIVTSSTYPVNKNYPLLGIAPDDIADFSADVDNLMVNLSWANPISEDFAGVTVSRDTSGFPESPIDGTQIYDGTGTNFADIVSGNSTYYYAAFSYDALGNYSTGAFTTADVTVPEPGMIICLVGLVFFYARKLSK